MLTHRQNAKRRTVIWQATAAAILLAAGTVVALSSQVGTLLAPPAAPTVTKRIVDTAPKGPPTVSPTVLVSAGTTLGKSSGFTPQPPPPPPPTTPVETQVVQEAPPPPPSTWTYIGSIITPSSRSALVKIDDAQQIVRLGSSVNEAELVTIEDGFIEIKKGVATERIALAERKLLAPTDPPKRPVAFRTPPTLPGGGGAVPGAPMAMGTPKPGTVPGPGASPVTFEQARAAAAAAREQARTAAAMNPPPRDEPNPEREAMLKMLSDPNISPEERTKVLGAVGITPGMGMDTMLEAAKKHGVELSKETIQAFEKMSKSEDAPKESK